MRAKASSGERVAFEGVVLASVLGQRRGRPVALDNRSEEATGTYSGQLVGVTDEYELAVGAFDVLEDGCEESGFGHAGLVDDQGAAGWKPALAGGREEAVERCCVDACFLLERFGGNA